MIEFLKSVIFSVGFYVIFGVIINNKLDKLTRFSDDDNTLKMKWWMIFYFFNFLCFLFLKNIRKIRKNEYYKTRIKEYDELIKIGLFEVNIGVEGYSKKEYYKIKRILKLNKLK